MSIILKSGTSSDLAKINTDNELNIAPTKVAANAGYVAMVSMNDSGSLTGVPYVESSETGQDYRLRVGIDTLLANYVFNGLAQYTHTWRHVFATMTLTMSGGSLLFNANSTLTASTGVQHSTWRTFPITGTSVQYFEFSVQSTSPPKANQIVELGQFTHNTGTAAPLDGTFFRYTSAGLIGVVTYNGVETTTGVFAETLLESITTKLTLEVGDREVIFWKDDVLLGSIVTPNGNGLPFITTALPASIQFRNPGTVTGSPVMQFKVFRLCVSQADLHTSKSWSHQMAALGQMAYQGQDGGTMGSTALYTNSLAAGVGAALTNTAASAGSGFGGQFSVQPTLAAGTDGILCSYQNPVGSVNQTPRILYITGVRIQGAVTTILTGGPVIYAYSLAVGHTAVSLATTDSATFATGTTKAPRRIALGFESYAATAAVGTIGQSVYMDFGNSPVVANPGEFVAICAKNLGTVTSGGVISILVTFAGYFE